MSRYLVDRVEHIDNLQIHRGAVVTALEGSCVARCRFAGEGCFYIGEIGEHMQFDTLMAIIRDSRR
jgi:hypothetical protein